MDHHGQRTTSLLKQQNEQHSAKVVAFNKKQAKKATARKSGAAQKTTLGGGSMQISVDEEGRSTNWVLFDPRHDFPPIHGETPFIFQHFAKYTPGNTKIVAYNIESYNISLRKTPSFFQDCKVEYHKNGPKLVRMRGMSPDYEPEFRAQARADSPLAEEGATGKIVKLKAADSMADPSATDSIAGPNAATPSGGASDETPLGGPGDEAPLGGVSNGSAASNPHLV